MNTAYIALGYACNEKCSFCPCSSKDRSFGALSINQICTIIDNLIDNHVNSVVISGGEPTIQETFLDTIVYALRHNLKINILSNSEKFSDDKFMELFKGVVKSRTDYITVTTTIHSQNLEEHESINGSVGSFKRTLKGLTYLYNLGIKIIVKHCITAKNYRDMKKFYLFINDYFPLDVSIQLCSIDYCGIGEGELEEQKIIYPNLYPYFEEIFDCCLEDEKKGKGRNIYCINMPFCSADPYYWKFFAEKPGTYMGYASPQIEEKGFLSLHNESIVGTFSDTCKKCKAESICPGTYKAAFQIYGNSIFKAYD